MNSDTVVIFLIVGLVLGILELYLVRVHKVNKWIVPILTWATTAIVAIPFSAAFGMFASLLQLVLVVCFILEAYFKKNADTDKIKIKNL